TALGNGDRETARVRTVERAYARLLNAHAVTLLFRRSGRYSGDQAASWSQQSVRNWPIRDNTDRLPHRSVAAGRPLARFGDVTNRCASPRRWQSRRGTLCLSPILEAQVLNPRELSGIARNQNHIQRASVAPNERIERPDRLPPGASEARTSP